MKFPHFSQRAPYRGSRARMAPVFSRPQLTRQIRRALLDLHDPVALRVNPLARELINGDGKADRAIALRAHLLRLIEALKPGSRTPANAKAWRAYRVLQLR